MTYVNSVITWNLRIIFFGCPLACYVWNVVGVALNLDAMPTSFSELYRQCFASFSGIDSKVVLIGVVALRWTLWRTRNNSFLDGMRPKDLTNVIFLICHFLNSWAKLQRSVLELCPRGNNKDVIIITSTVALANVRAYYLKSFNYFHLAICFSYYLLYFKLGYLRVSNFGIFLYITLSRINNK
jgi:hypothetical protein